MDLLWEILIEVERRAVTGGEDLLQELPVDAVWPRLLGLALDHLLAQLHQLSRHADVLDCRDGVMSGSLENYRDGV